MKEFANKVETLRQEIIGAIRSLLTGRGLTDYRLTKEQDDAIWVIWFGKNSEPYECMVTGVSVIEDGIVVHAYEREGAIEVSCNSRYDLGARNIDWLLEIYEAIKRELDEKEPQFPTEVSGRVEWF